MYRATTPTHIFTLPFAAEQLKAVRITYRQLGKTVLQKTEADCTLAGNTVRLELTQQESLLFQSTDWVYVQLRAVTDGGKVLASQIEKLWPQTCLDEEVLE